MHTHTRMYMYAHTCTCTHTYTCTLIYTCTCIHACIHIYMYSHACTHMYMHTHTYVPVHSHTCVHTHICEIHATTLHKWKLPLYALCYSHHPGVPDQLSRVSWSMFPDLWDLVTVTTDCISICIILETIRNSESQAPSQVLWIRIWVFTNSRSAELDHSSQPHFLLAYGNCSGHQNIARECNSTSVGVQFESAEPCLHTENWENCAVLLWAPPPGVGQHLP